MSSGKSKTAWAAVESSVGHGCDVHRGAASATAIAFGTLWYYQYGERTVHLDACVEVEAAYYDVPPGWIGRRVQVQWNASHVRLRDPFTGQLLREHLRHERGRHRIKDEDRPQRTALSTKQLLHRAEKAGQHIGALCQTMYRNHGELAVRRIPGVLSLVEKYGVASTNDVCPMALETGACKYRFVRRSLEHNLQLRLSLRQVDPLIRQLTRTAPTPLRSRLP